jgi:predicted cupin superfamily sugar epimerase
MKITFFHFMASLNEDFLNSALIDPGFELKNFEIRPF